MTDISKVKISRTFMIPLPIAEEFKQYAFETKQDMSSLVSQAIAEMLKNRKAKRE